MRAPGIAVLLLTACASGAPSEARPSAAQAVALPDPARILFWTPDQQRVGYKSVEHLGPTRTVAASPTTKPIPTGEPLPMVRYTVDGETFDTDAFVEHNRVTGLLVIADGRIVLERYAGGNDIDTRWISFSVTKSIVSLLIGAAIQDGKIGSVDEPVTKYLPNLAGTAYDGVTIEDVLRMASGVEWNEDYTDADSDVGKTARFSAPQHLEYLASKPRAAEPGTKFNYNTGETHLVGAVLRSAIGGDLAPYLSEKIWKPYGMRRDAVWPLLEKDGAEHGGCCLAATLRDFGRLGLFTLANGDVLPEDWMKRSTTPSPGYPGYGYLWWLNGDTYAAAGIFGQSIWVSPADGLVIATHSMWPKATGKPYTAHRAAFYAAVAAALRN